MLAEPSMDDLIGYGIDNEGDRKKFYYAIHPEERPSASEQGRPSASMWILRFELWL
jgi:hypothetical protein